MKPALRLYPILFGVVPVLRLAADHPGEWTDLDLARVVAVTAGGVALLYAVIFALCRGRTAPGTPALLTLLAVAWLLYYMPIYRELQGMTDGAVRHRVLLPGGLLLTALALWRLPRLARSARLASGLTLASVTLAGLAGFAIVRDRWRGASLVAASPTLQAMAGPIPGVPDSVERRAGRAPDIYLIVLDEFAGPAILRERFDLDVGPVLDSLRRLGFTIPGEVRANYVKTHLSLPSLLNFGHVTTLDRELDPAGAGARVPAFLIENNRAVRLLKSYGYEFVFFPSAFWPRTASNRNADVQFDASASLGLRRTLTRTALRRAVAENVMVSLVLPPASQADPEFVRRTFAGLKTLHRDQRPIFAFAHILLPHAPFVFDADCRERANPAPDSKHTYDTPEARRLYADQVQCANRLVLDLVTHLLRRSPEPPIIILQGDHGTASLGYWHVESLEDLSPAQARERILTFGAYHLPGARRPELPDTLTLVNLLPRIFNAYLDTAIPLSSDELYVSLEASDRFERSPWPPTSPGRTAAAGTLAPGTD